MRWCRPQVERQRPAWCRAGSAGPEHHSCRHRHTRGHHTPHLHPPHLAAPLQTSTSSTSPPGCWSSSVQTWLAPRCRVRSRGMGGRAGPRHGHGACGAGGDDGRPRPLLPAVPRHRGLQSGWRCACHRACGLAAPAPPSPPLPRPVPHPAAAICSRGGRHPRQHAGGGGLQEGGGPPGAV